MTSLPAPFLLSDGNKPNVEVRASETPNSAYEGFRACSLNKIESEHIDEADAGSRTLEFSQCDVSCQTSIFPQPLPLLKSTKEILNLNGNEEGKRFKPKDLAPSNSFLTNPTMGSSLCSLAEAEGTSLFQRSVSPSEDDELSDSNVESPETNEALTWALRNIWPEFPVSAFPEERLRLAGDRTGVGLPLKRWVGDGKELDHDEGLFPTVYHVEWGSEDNCDDDKFVALNWLERPYEDHLMTEFHGLPRQEDQADQARVTSVEQVEGRGESSNDLWLQGAVAMERQDGETPISEWGEENTRVSGSVTSTSIILASPVDVKNEWDLEDDVVEVMPMPIEDEEVFVLAPNLFDQ